MFLIEFSLRPVQIIICQDSPQQIMHDVYVLLHQHSISSASNHLLCWVFIGHHFFRKPRNHNFLLIPIDTETCWRIFHYQKFKFRVIVMKLSVSCLNRSKVMSIKYSSEEENDVNNSDDG